MKILNLVLYSDNDKNYVKMYEVLSPYYKRFSDVTTYFYKYNDNNYKLRNMCNNGFYKIPIPCMSKKKSNNNDSFKFPETTLFSSVGDSNCIK